jgi:hypothetical protein
MEEMYEEIEYINSISSEELQAHELANGFKSFGRASDEIYYPIVTPIEAEDQEFTEEQAKVYVSEYPKYLEITKDGDGEKTFLPKYFTEQYRYVMNEDRLFRVCENIFKVFKNAVIYTDIAYADKLWNITEENIDATIDEIIKKEEGNDGESNPIKIHKNKKPSAWSGIQTYPPTPPVGCSGRTYGTRGRYHIYTESYPSSSGKEKVCANFYCDSKALESNDYWDCLAYYSVYALWRGCKNCIWIGCSRTLHSSICMEILVDDTVYSVTDNYNSTKPERGAARENVFWKRIPFRYYANGTVVQATRGSIYNLTGTIWIATASRTLNY